VEAVTLEVLRNPHTLLIRTSLVLALVLDFALGLYLIVGFAFALPLAASTSALVQVQARCRLWLRRAGHHRRGRTDHPTLPFVSHAAPAPVGGAHPARLLGLDAASHSLVGWLGLDPLRRRHHSTCR
jgi:hypothetical protein